MAAPESARRIGSDTTAAPSALPGISRLFSASNRLFGYCAIRHEYKLPDSLSAAFQNGNRVAGLSLSRHFAGCSDSVLEVISGFQRIFRALVDDVELRHISSLFEERQRLLYMTNQDEFRIKIM